jgi:hypothetical protein
MDIENNEVEIIKLVHDTHRNEMNFHREVMSKTIQWVTHIFLAISGGMLALGPTKWNSFGCPAKIMVSVLVLIIVVFVIFQILHSSSAINSNAKIVVKSDIAMKLFENNNFGQTESIYPQNWQVWGSQKSAGYYEKLHIFITLSLGTSVIAFAWFI